MVPCDEMIFEGSKLYKLQFSAVYMDFSWQRMYLLLRYL